MMTHQQLIREGLALIPQLTANQPTILGQTAVLYRLNEAPQMTAYLLAHRQDEPSLTPDQLVALSQQMAQRFDQDGLRELCFQLGN